MEKLRIKVNGKTYDVEVEILESSSKGVVTKNSVSSNEQQSVQPVPVKKKRASTGSGISAPIAGVVKEIKVKPGDSVDENQLVIVLEAMKMNTNVLADSSGTVNEILCAVGDSVKQGDLLIRL